MERRSTRTYHTQTVFDGQITALHCVIVLWTEIYLTDRPENEKQRVMDVLCSISPLPLDIQSAKYAGEINGQLIHKGMPIDPEDRMIAGIARTHNEPTLTRNASHYGRIKGIWLKTY